MNPCLIYVLCCSFPPTGVECILVLTPEELEGQVGLSIHMSEIKFHRVFYVTLSISPNPWTCNMTKK